MNEDVPDLYKDYSIAIDNESMFFVHSLIWKLCIATAFFHSVYFLLILISSLIFGLVTVASLFTSAPVFPCTYKAMVGGLGSYGALLKYCTVLRVSARVIRYNQWHFTLERVSHTSRADQAMRETSNFHFQ